MAYREIRLKGGLDINESQKASYRYTLGLGLFLMSGCYDYLSHSPKSQDDQNIFNQANDDSSSSSSNEEKSSSDDSEEDKETRRKRSAQKFPNQTDFRSFCRKFAQLQKNRECNVSENYQFFLNKTLNNYILNI